MLIATGVSTSIASEEQCDAQGATGCDSQDVQSAMQAHVSVKGRSRPAGLQERVEVREHLDDVNSTESPACISAKLSMMQYYVGTAHALPAPPGFTVKRTYEHNTTSGDVDRAMWIEGGHGACWIAFMGSNHGADFANNFHYTPMEKWGIPGVHSGVVAELEPLVNLIGADFANIRSDCYRSLTVTGHSLGGGLAQLFSMAINKQGDPLGANLTVDYLYTTGAMAVVDNAEGNDKSPDGCFAGRQDWYAEMSGTDVVVDVVAMPLVGGQHTHVPSKSNKRFVFANGTAAAFPCGTPLPPAQSLYLQKSYADWSHLHNMYLAWLRC